ncbi:MAG: helix-turn-helix domain-containing protein, partial [Clostridia bacterium]
MEKLCFVLKDLIQEKDLSLRGLAEESGVSATQYSMYLRGTFPTIDSAVR